ncbi:MAG: bifunctional hydroxymethylpyrimidine kinase/phosphomethylpyrimidine kinase [Acidimicrobiales bacterium]
MGLSGRRLVALTVAGTDSGGGAGVAADLKTFEAHGLWGTCAVTAVTAQDTVGVHAVATLAPELVAEQIDRVVGDIGVDAVKTGMLATGAIVSAVAAALGRHRVARLVVDPVMASGHGDALLDDDAVETLLRELVPMATVVTPNLAEASRLAGFAVDDRAAIVTAGRVLVDRGAKVVLVKGGHLGGERSPDCIVATGAAQPVWLESDRLEAHSTHGTGCVLSAAICAELARGMDPVDACVAAKAFCLRAIAAGVRLGAGVGPVDPGWAART